MIFSGFVVGIVIINEIQRMTGWHAESSKQIAWENYKRKMRVGVGEIVRSENGFRRWRWVPRARAVNDCSIRNDKRAAWGNGKRAGRRKRQEKENKRRRNLSRKAKLILVVPARAND